MQLINDDPDKVVLKFPDIPWAQIRALRNRSAHNYFSMDPKIIWDFVTDEIPAIEHELRRILEKRYRITEVEDYT